MDVLAVSLDSFDEEVNIKIGRGRGQHCQNARKAADLCSKYGTFLHYTSNILGIKFKVNTGKLLHKWLLI